MSNNLRKCLNKMKHYCNTDCKNLKKSMLHEMSSDDKYFNAILEIITNVSLKNIAIPVKEKNKLKKHIKVFNKIMIKPKNKKIRKKLIKQSGGAWPILIPFAIEAVRELIEYVGR